MAASPSSVAPLTRLLLSTTRRLQDERQLAAARPQDTESARRPSNEPPSEANDTQRSAQASAGAAHHDHHHRRGHLHKRKHKPEESEVVVIIETPEEYESHVGHEESAPSARKEERNRSTVVHKRVGNEERQVSTSKRTGKVASTEAKATHWSPTNPIDDSPKGDAERTPGKQHKVALEEELASRAGRQMPSAEFIQLRGRAVERIIGSSQQQHQHQHHHDHHHDHHHHQQSLEQTPPVDAKTDQPVDCALLIGVPLAGCLIFAMILYLVLKYCRRLSERMRGKSHKSGQRAAAAKKAASARIAKPIVNLISNGKLLASDLKQGRPKLADCRQLTINMEDGAGVGGLEAAGQQNGTTDDSDEQPSRTSQWGRLRNKTVAPGRLRYALSYDFGARELAVTIVEARDLPPMDLNGYSDPYVKVHLEGSPASASQRAGNSTATNCKRAHSSGRSGNNSSQDEQQQQQQPQPQHRNQNSPTFKTKIHKRTLNPVFNETFKFQVGYAELRQQTLVLAMYDYDRMSRHDDMGRVSVRMDSLDLASEQDHWVELCPAAGAAREQRPNGDLRLGDVCLSLRYVPTAGKLNVVVLEARQLKKMDVAGLSDPYVKLALMLGDKRLKKKKTSIKKCTLNPHYNESFSFELPFELVQQVRLVVTVVDYDRIGTSEPIGKLTLGCDVATGEPERRHWLDMLASPRRPIAQWHSLKDIDFEEELAPAAPAAVGANPSWPTGNR